MFELWNTRSGAVLFRRDTPETVTKFEFGIFTPKLCETPLAGLDRVNTEMPLAVTAVHPRILRPLVPLESIPQALKATSEALSITMPSPSLS